MIPLLRTRQSASSTASAANVWHETPHGWFCLGVYTLAVYSRCCKGSLVDESGWAMGCAPEGQKAKQVFCEDCHQLLEFSPVEDFAVSWKACREWLSQLLEGKYGPLGVVMEAANLEEELLVVRDRLVVSLNLDLNDLG